MHSRRQKGSGAKKTHHDAPSAQKRALNQGSCIYCKKYLYRYKDAITKALINSRVLGLPLRVYRCPYNRGLFHLTKKVR